MARILALQGKGNSGKTTTINMLPALLLSAGYRQVPGMHKPYGYDFMDFFEKGGKRVGLTSAGDTYDAVHERLKDLLAASCDVCVCACRTRDNGTHGTNAAVHSFPGNTNEFMQKSYETIVVRQPIVNDLDAHSMFNLI